MKGYGSIYIGFLKKFMTKAIYFYRNTLDLEKKSWENIISNIKPDKFSTVEGINTFRLTNDNDEFFDEVSNILKNRLQSKEEVMIFGYSFNTTLCLNIMDLENIKGIVLVCAPFNPKCINLSLRAIINSVLNLWKHKRVSEFILNNQKLFINKLTIRIVNPFKFFRRLPDIYKTFTIPKEESKRFTSILKAFSTLDFTKMLLVNSKKILVINGQKDKIFSKYIKKWSIFPNCKSFEIKNGDHDILDRNSKEIIEILNENI